MKGAIQIVGMIAILAIILLFVLSMRNVPANLTGTNQCEMTVVDPDARNVIISVSHTVPGRLELGYSTDAIACGVKAPDGRWCYESESCAKVLRGIFIDKTFILETNGMYVEGRTESSPYPQRQFNFELISTRENGQFVFKCADGQGCVTLNPAMIGGSMTYINPQGTEPIPVIPPYQPPTQPPIQPQPQQPGTTTSIFDMIISWFNSILRSFGLA